jgi:hypothetical protein
VGEQGVGIETDAGQRRGPDVGEEHVGGGEQLHHRRLALVGLEVEHDAALRAVVELERRVGVQLAAEHLAEDARRVARGRLHLDDVGAPVGEDAAGGRPGHPHPQLDDTNPFQRSRHGGRSYE